MTRRPYTPPKKAGPQATVYDTVLESIRANETDEELQVQIAMAHAEMLSDWHSVEEPTRPAPTLAEAERVVLARPEFAWARKRASLP